MCDSVVAIDNIENIQCFKNFKFIVLFIEIYFVEFFDGNNSLVDSNNCVIT